MQHFVWLGSLKMRSKAVASTRTHIPYGWLGCWIISILTISILGSCTPTNYYQNSGYVFGTYYNIRYEATRDLEPEIIEALQHFDASLSMFNPESTITRINRGESTATDSLFEVMYYTAREVSDLSHGAFDITVRPLVNAWGFGNSKAQGTYRATVDRLSIDSLRTFVGYEKIRIEDHQLLRDDNRTTLDASAIAKGFGVDVVANLIAATGSTNYLVDIGGEVVAHGRNHQHQPWRVGISKPIDDPDGTSHELQVIIETRNIAMATSGNYRQFYQDGDIRRSHTIDPRTGEPVQHTLLSATVIANSCMRADALATACMVLGPEEAIRMIESTNDAACYLIVSAENGTKILTSKRWMAEK